VTRLQAALLELREALGDRPWILVLDPVSPDAEDWGYALEHSAHPGYVRLGLLRMGTIHLEKRLLERGKIGRPISQRDRPFTRATHDFDTATPNVLCRRCGRTEVEVARFGGLCERVHKFGEDGTCERCGIDITLGDADGPCLLPGERKP